MRVVGGGEVDIENKLMDSSDHENEIENVSADRVLRRSFILAALTCRGSIESGAGQPEAEDVHRRLIEWMAPLGLESELEAQERVLLNTKLGGLSSKDTIQATWSVEGLAVLMWALSLIDLPRHDEKVDPYALTDTLRFLSSDAVELFGSVKLRSPNELSAYREVAYGIHCRLRDYIRH